MAHHVSNLCPHCFAGMNKICKSIVSTPLSDEVTISAASGRLVTTWPGGFSSSKEVVQA